MWWSFETTSGLDLHANAPFGVQWKKANWLGGFSNGKVYNLINGLETVVLHNW